MSRIYVELNNGSVDWWEDGHTAAMESGGNALLVRNDRGNIAAIYNETAWARLFVGEGPTVQGKPTKGNLA